VARAPEFIGAGRLEFRINLVRAQNEASRGDIAVLRNAATALGRDIGRHPFEPTLVTDYLRVALNWMPVKEALAMLARPLRHNRLADTYVTVLQHLSQSAELDAALVALEQEALKASADAHADAASRWAPEKLRVIGAVRFLRGEFHDAIRVLRAAVVLYDKLAASAPMGSSACHAELADALFYADMLHPEAAITAAKQAIQLAPRSEPGRALRFATEQRMIQYLLAGGNEIDAVSLLRSHAPAGASDTDVKAQHGRRLRMLLEAMRVPYREELRANDPNSEVVGFYRRLLARGLELNPAESGLHYLAADLAVLDGNGAIAARALEAALRQGLALEEASRFLDASAALLPDSQELRALRARVDAAQAGAERDPTAPPINRIRAPSSNEPSPTSLDAP
jgi:hypothetical protein